MAAWINRTALSGGSIAQNGTNSHTVSFTAATNGNFLVAVVAGSVTFTTPSGWTLAISSVYNTGLYVFTKTASASESSFSTTHNATNYPIRGVVYEFPAGTTVIGSNWANAQNRDSPVTGPTVSSLTGTYTRMAARSYSLGSASSTADTTWTVPSVEDYDAYTPQGGVDGIALTVAYDDSQTASSFTCSSVMTTTNVTTTNGEGVAWALSIPTADTPPEAYVAGWTSHTSSFSSSTFTVNPVTNLTNGSCAVNDWIIAVFMSAANATNTKQPSPPAGWTNIIPFGTVGSGTMCFGIWAHQRAAGETSYTWSQSTTESSGNGHRLIFVRGAADIASWVMGSFDLRQNTGTTTTNVAASITTVSANNLTLLISGERTTAAETDSQVTCTNFTKLVFENNQDQSIFLATKDMAAAGATSSSTVTYPNTHSFNGIAGIIGIPPLANIEGGGWLI